MHGGRASLVSLFLLSASHGSVDVEAKGREADFDVRHASACRGATNVIAPNETCIFHNDS